MMSDDWHLNIQWKGTDVCCDFVCPECGEQDHIDGFFVYAIKCCACGSVWRLPTSLELERIADGEEPCTVLANEPELDVPL